MHRNRNGRAPRLLALAAAVGMSCAAYAADPALFQQPPQEARPRVWWHWMNGNVDNKGIKLDLEWMHRIGIGGVHIFDVDLGTAQYVDQPAEFMSPRWLDSVRYTTTEAGKLGMEVAISGGSGWSESGGPWVTPQQGMKKYVWAETKVDGPRHFSGTLAAPPSVSGPFQNIPIHRQSDFAPMPDGSPGGQPYSRQKFTVPQWYADAAVIAYRLPDAEAAAPTRTITASGGTFTAAALDDGDFEHAQKLPLSPDASKPAWLQIEYAQPVRAQAVTLSIGQVQIPDGAIKVSADGVNWETVATLPGSVHSGLSTTTGVRTYAFAERAVRFVRLELGNPARNFLDDVMGKPRQTAHDIAEFSVATTGRVHRYEDKAGFSIAEELESLATPAVAADMAVRSQSVVDLTGKLRADGSLDWDVPAGRWAILRLGYSLTGQTNDPATQQGVGLEVDKLDRAAVTSHFETYLGKMADAKGLSHLMLDSWEANQQNWTTNMLAEFRQRRGYDPLPWLAVLSGRVVDSAEASDRFLWDFRRTIADLISDNHYGVAADVAHKHGMQLYAEAMGVNLPTVGDGLQAKGRVDIPMGEFWDRNPGEKPIPNQVSDIREAASAAHIYGKQLVAAEAFTATPIIPSFSRSPRDLKWIADQYMALGVNRFVIHASPHQPFENRKPGVSLWRFGQHFTRNETWAEQARPWIDYLSRASYMLQQGRAINDIAYFYGEGAPVAAPFAEPDRPGVPAGFGYDYVNAEVLLQRASVREGRIELESGASYRLLVLPSSTTAISLPLLRKLRELVEAGAVILGPKPRSTPGMGDQQELAQIAEAMWGDADGRTVAEHRYGKGKVVSGREIGTVLEGLNVTPDYAFSRQYADSEIVATHRIDKGTEIYFVANQKARAEKFKASFRVSGLQPELWYADSGKTAPAVWREEGGRTIVSLDMEQHGSVFVVFRAAAAVTQATSPETALALVPAVSVTRPLATLSGPWKLDFTPGGGAPASITLPNLASWSASSVDGIKYYSGSATYRRELKADAAWLRKNARILLDLGAVEVMAQVKLNGKPLPLLWKSPYVADVTGLLKPGANALEITVTNLWPNRLIGDAQPGVTQPYTFSTFKPYQADGKLMPSGLLGPVRLLSRSAE
ncbi:glycoside hydrolase [Duganella sp. FT135W]|uniref:Glycoside hydrolase n=1 Tax=Duganella flavida TaxID=2692175 RepID=A0A6L8KEH1_9BURK|nr:glycosyl hydrolase [Duganella flavida]MYM25410.1 glycoside hydrolase [Duganella flavida]